MHKVRHGVLFVLHGRARFVCWTFLFLVHEKSFSLCLVVAGTPNFLLVTVFCLLEKVLLAFCGLD
jgi:hypothetical protein